MTLWLYHHALLRWMFEWIFSIIIWILNFPVFLVSTAISTYWLVHLQRSEKKASVGRKSTAKNNLILMLVTTDLDFDPRVRNGAIALAEKGFQVSVISPGLPNQQDRLDWGPNISFKILSEGCYFLYRFPYYFSRIMLNVAVKEDPWAIHCHDLNTCLVGIAAAKKTGAHCICDFHEIYSENLSMSLIRRRFVPHSKLKKKWFSLGERAVMKCASEVITVCDSLAEHIQKKFNSTNFVHVIRNIPYFQHTTSKDPINIRKQVGANSDTFILLYQGGVSASRYLEPVIEAMKFVSNAIFVIRGQGVVEYKPQLLKLAKSMGVEDKIFLLDPVPSDRVVIEASTADAGIWTLKPICLNFECALPNKVYEYLHAGIPLLTANLPEVKKIVEQFDIGLCFNPNSPENIAQAINKMAENPDLCQRFRGNISKTIEANQPEKEWQKLVSLYEHI